MTAKVEALIKALSTNEIPFRFYETSDTGHPVITLYKCMEDDSEKEICIFLEKKDTPYPIKTPRIRIEDTHLQL
jgi:hypothetical protein